MHTRPMILCISIDIPSLFDLNRRVAIHTRADVRARTCTHRRCRRAQRTRCIEPRPSASATVARRRAERGAYLSHV